MVHHVGRPPKTLFMRDPMRPVPHKIEAYKAEDIRPPAMGKTPGRYIITDNNNVKDAHLGKCINKQISKTYGRGGQEILTVIKLSLLFNGEVILDYYQ